jgi:hypothetical protein
MRKDHHRSLARQSSFSEHEQLFSSKERAMKTIADCLNAQPEDLERKNERMERQRGETRITRRRLH